MLADLLEDEEFLALPEEEQIAQLQQNQSFAAAYSANREKTLSWMRGKTGKPAAETSVVGEIIRQFGSGLGESVTDVAQLPFEAAEWVASAAGSDWSTGVDEAIEKFSAEAFPEPTSQAGRIARGTGYGAGLGVQTALTGGVLGSLGVVARAPRLIKAGRLLSGGASVEIGAGSTGGAAASTAAEFTDNPWLVAGAGILAGGATGVGIAARGAMKRARSTGQPGAASAVRSSAEQAARDAVENASADEIVDLGIDPRTLEAAREFDAQQTLESFVQGTHAQMEPEQLRRITQASGKVFEEAGLELDESKTFISQLAGVIESGRIPKQQVDEILEGFGTSLEEIASDELADAFLKTGKEAGRSLRIFGVEAQRIRAASAARKKAMGRPLTSEEESALRQVGGPNGEGMGFWRRLENVRRGLLVTQLATAMRNFETQVANVSIHTLEDALEAGILKIFPEAVQKSHPTNALGTLTRLMGSFNPFKKSKSFEEVEGLKNFFKKEIDPLFARWSSDIEVAPGHGPVGGLEKATLMLNSANRLQEFAIRRAVFTSELDRILSARGTSLEKLAKHGRLKSLDRDDIKGAVKRALEVTWGSEFHSGMDGASGVAGNLIDAINNIGFGPFRATQVIPFPRFMANSIRWQYQHSPLPLMKSLVSPTDWRKIAAGDIKPLIKSTTGTGLFLGAHQLRSSEWAGEHWFQIRPPPEVADALGIEPGSTIDMRPFNPFASYLFAADVVKRMGDGTLNSFTTRDVAMGFMATNLRAGAGLYVLDEALNKMSQSFQAPESMEEAFKAFGQAGAEYTGAAWSGALVPFQQLRDITAHFDETQRTLRDQGVEPLQGSFKRKLPYADENLPEVQLPTREAAPRTEAPLMRQLTGLTVRGPKNAGEVELDKMGFSRGEILPSSGNDDYDRLRAKYMGPLFEQFVNPYVQSRDYLEQPPEEKAVLLQKLLARVRQGATRQAAAERPDLYLETKEGRRSKRQQKLIARRQRDFRDRQERLEEQRKAAQ